MWCYHHLAGTIGRSVWRNPSRPSAPGKLVYPLGDEYGFGLGFAILTNPAKSADALSIGTFTWGGAYGTLFWIDPHEDLIGILMIQIRPYLHLNIRSLFSAAAVQAMTDSSADHKPRIMGYDTPR